MQITFYRRIDQIDDTLILDNNLLATKQNHSFENAPEIKHQFISLNEAIHKLIQKGYKIIRIIY